MEDYRTAIYARYASLFQGSGESFDREAAQRWGRAYKHYLRGWLPSNHDAKILEVACGNGKFLYFLQELGYRNIAGIDISPEQVMIAKQVCPEVVQGDVLEYLEGVSGCYDLIIGLDIVEHFTKGEVVAFLERCRNSLRPGGRMILQTPNANSPWGMACRYGDFSHEICLNPSAASQLLRLAGFKEVDVRETGPVIHGVKSTLRYIMWRFLRQFLNLWSLTEVGSLGEAVYTRVFLVSATKG